MRIMLQPLSGSQKDFEIDQALQRAFGILHEALIRTRGGGRFADSSGAIILARDSDAPLALAALKGAGIEASAN